MRKPKPLKIDLLFSGNFSVVALFKFIEFLSSDTGSESPFALIFPSEFVMVLSEGLGLWFKSSQMFGSDLLISFIFLMVEPNDQI